MNLSINNGYYWNLVMTVLVITENIAFVASEQQVYSPANLEHSYHVVGITLSLTAVGSLKLAKPKITVVSAVNPRESMNVL